MPKGFTLIEVTIVLAILGLVAGLVLARGPHRSAALDMRAATATVAQQLRLARSRAIASNRPVPVHFDPAHARLAIANDPPHALPTGIAMAVTTTADQTASILFLPDGTSTGGHVDLAAPGRQSQIGIDWLTGRVSVAN